MDCPLNIWHKIYLIKNTDGTVTGEWEWNHEVEKQGNDQAWNDNDTRFGDVEWDDDEFSQTGFSSVELPRNNPGSYQITAYTRVSLDDNNNNELTRPSNGEIRRNKRSIKSIWFKIQ